MKLEDLRFTDKEAKRILAVAAEREARDQTEERTIGYDQLVKIAQESLIDPKYLKVSTKQLVKEAGGLERATVTRMMKFSKNLLIEFLNGYFNFTRPLPEEYPDLTLISRMIGITSYFGTLIVPVVHNFPEELRPYAIALGSLATLTNMGSGLHKWYRYEKNRLIEEMNGEKKSEE